MFDPEELQLKLAPADPGFYTLERCRTIAARLERVVELKKRRNAVILAHNYQQPEIFEVADFMGDSLELSLRAAEVGDADVIIFCGVHFMAEIAKIVSPSKTVILPNPKAGCALADTADAVDVARWIAELRREHPDLSVVSYVNSTAAVKALSDACCTSANAADVVRAMPSETILFIPDRNLAAYVASNVPAKLVIPWDGYCYVQQEIQPAAIERIRRSNPDIKVLVHPECRDDVIAIADAALSTSGMLRYARQSDAQDFLAVTECGISDLLAIQAPDKRFYRACKICRYMKMITLEDVIRSLERLEPEITVPEEVRAGAERAIKRMFELTSPDRMPASLAKAT